VADEALGLDVGDSFTIAGRTMRVVGETRDRTFFGGIPILFMTLADAQRIAFDGRPLASTIAIAGRPPAGLPPGLAVLGNDAVREDLVRPLEGPTAAIDLLRVLMWVVAAVILGAVVYLSALERVREFAVLKATGAASRTLAGSLAIEALIASVLACAIGAGVATALQSSFPMPVTISAGAYLGLLAVAAAVGVVASLAALRRAVAVDPALAFEG
jgi:putative ABC transport system permease protein